MSLAVNSRDDAMRLYRNLYDSHVNYLRLHPNPADSRQILIGAPPEVMALSKFYNVAHAGMSQSAKDRAAAQAVRYSNSLGQKAKAAIEGPLHPSNIERQIVDNLDLLQQHYSTALVQYKHEDNDFARDLISFHSLSDRNWINYVESVASLLDAGIPLASIRARPL